MRKLLIKYDIGQEIKVADIEGIHRGIIKRISWNSRSGTYYTVQYNTDEYPLLIWEFSEEELDRINT